MKTKEIDVWVCKNTFNKSNSHLWVYKNFYKAPEGIQYLKAKLIIEIPEKKVTITESEFDDALKNCFIGDNNSRYLKKELGF